MRFMEDISNAADAHGYQYTASWHCKQLGIHPGNRDGEGMKWRRSQARIEKIKKAGCSLAVLTPNLRATEDSPMKHIEKNTLSQTSSAPEFARYREGDIKAGMLGATHAVHGFAQLYDEAPCDIESISDGGNMSQSNFFLTL